MVCSSRLWNSYDPPYWSQSCNINMPFWHLLSTPVSTHFCVLSMLSWYPLACLSISIMFFGIHLCCSLWCSCYWYCMPGYSGLVYVYCNLNGWSTSPMGLCYRSYCCEREEFCFLFVTSFILVIVFLCWFIRSFSAPAPSAPGQPQLISAISTTSDRSITFSFTAGGSSTAYYLAFLLAERSSVSLQSKQFFDNSSVIIHTMTDGDLWPMGQGYILPSTSYRLTVQVFLIDSIQYWFVDLCAWHHGRPTVIPFCLCFRPVMLVVVLNPFRFSFWLQVCRPCHSFTAAFSSLRPAVQFVDSSCLWKSCIKRETEIGQIIICWIFLCCFSCESLMHFLFFLCVRSCCASLSFLVCWLSYLLACFLSPFSCVWLMPTRSQLRDPHSANWRWSLNIRMSYLSADLQHVVSSGLYWRARGHLRSVWMVCTNGKLLGFVTRSFIFFLLNFSISWSVFPIHFFSFCLRFLILIRTCSYDWWLSFELFPHDVSLCACWLNHPCKILRFSLLVAGLRAPGQPQYVSSNSTFGARTLTFSFTPGSMIDTYHISINDVTASVTYSGDSYHLSQPVLGDNNSTVFTYTLSSSQLGFLLPNHTYRITVQVWFF